MLAFDVDLHDLLLEMLSNQLKDVEGVNRSLDSDWLSNGQLAKEQPLSQLNVCRIHASSDRSEHNIDMRCAGRRRMYVETWRCVAKLPSGHR